MLWLVQKKANRAKKKLIVNNISIAIVSTDTSHSMTGALELKMSMSSCSSESSDDGGVVVCTPSQILRRGLLRAGYKKKSIKKCKKSTNLEQFTNRCGASPTVLAHMWEDIQKGDDPVPPHKLNLECYFMAIHFLKRYPEEHERAAQCGWHRDTCRDWSWCHVEKIRALKKN